MGKAALLGKSLRNVSVGRRFSVGDLGEDLPYGKAKRSADEMEGRRGFRLFSRKVQGQPAPSFSQCGRFFCLYFCRESGGKVFLPLEPKAGESHVIRCEEDGAKGGV